MKAAVVVVSAALALPRLAHGDDVATVQALMDCYNREYGFVHRIPATSWDTSHFLVLPPIDDRKTQDLFRGAFEGDVRLVDAALRDGASAAAMVDYHGKPARPEALGGTAEEQFERRVPPKNPIGRARMPSIEPRLAQLGMLASRSENTTPLMWAVLGLKKKWCLQEPVVAGRAELDVVSSLVRAGANPGVEDVNGGSAVAIAISGSYPTSPSKEASEELARYLIDSVPGTIPRAVLTRWLILASARGSVALAKQLLEKGADAKDDEALWQARSHGWEEIASLLEARGARLDMSDGSVARARIARAADERYTLDLLSKAQEGRLVISSVASPAMLRRLGAAGASCAGGLAALVRREGVEPETRLESARILLDELRCDPNEVAEGGKGESPVMLVNDSESELVNLLVKHGGRARTPTGAIGFFTFDKTLWWAAVNGRPNLVGAMLAWDQPSKKDVESAMHYAVESRKTVIVAAMTAHGANPNGPAVYDRDGQSLLMNAMWLRDYETAKVLLAAGADVNARTLPRPWPWEYQWSFYTEGDPYPNRGKLTALMLAARQGDEFGVRLLLDNGADKALRSERGQSAEDMAKEYHPQVAKLIARYPK